MSRRISKKLGYENLEQRRLLAADLATDFLQCEVETEPVVQCEMAMDFTEESAMIDLSIDAAEEIANGEQVAPRVQELDLSDGSDGFFGTLSESNSDETFGFQTEANGTVDVVVASSFGDASTILEVRDSQGDLISATSTEGLDSFHSLRFDVNEGEAYELTISSEEGVNGNYQITVGFEAESTTESPEITVDEVDAPDPNGNQTDTVDTMDGLTLDSLDDSNADCETPTESESEPTEIMDETGASDDTVVENDFDSAANEDSASQGTVTADVDSMEESTDSEVEPEAQPEVDPQIQPVVEAGPVTPTTPPTGEPAPQPVDNTVDLHADEISSGSTELSLATGRATMLGQLESSGDVDTFRMTPQFDGSMDIFLADTTAESDLDLNISVYNGSGDVLLDGATNEFVKLTMDVVADNEYYVSVSADDGQSGDYALIADFSLPPEPADDHANVIGPDATELSFSDGNLTATGEIQFASDTDAFRFTANCDETMTLVMDVDSTDYQSDAQVTVFSQDGELIAQGTTNNGVNLTFDTFEGIEYQILVDSINDSPMSFQLTAKPVEDAADESLAADGVDESIDQVINECANEMADCDEDRSLDRVFSELGEELSPIDTLDKMNHELAAEMSSLLRFARQI